jgi:RND family efflux transporter MFP subunit
VVDRGDIQVAVGTTGQIQANKQVALSFPANGKVNAILVNEGDHVLKGQTIATVDSTDANDALLQAQVKLMQQQVALKNLTDKPRQVDINVSQANLDLAKAALKSASSGGDPLQTQIDAVNTEIAKNQLWQTQLTRDANNARKADLQSNPKTASAANNLPSDVQNNASIAAADYGAQIAQAQLQAAQTTGADVGSIASAQAQVTSAQVDLTNLLNPNPNDVAQAKAQVDAAQAALDFARQNVDKTNLIAPFNGTVAKINLHIGEFPPTTAPVVMIDTSSFYIDVPIQETDIAKIEIGEPAALTFDALPGVTVNGKVSRVAQTSTLSGSVVTYTAEVQIDPAGQPLLSSMSATVNVIISQVQNVVRIRNRFVRLDRQTRKTYANVMQADGTFKEVEITLGLRNDTYSEVKSGLSAGDVVGPVQASTGFGGNPGGFVGRAIGGGGGG